MARSRMRRHGSATRTAVEKARRGGVRARAKAAAAASATATANTAQAQACAPEATSAGAPQPVASQAAPQVPQQSMAQGQPPYLAEDPQAISPVGAEGAVAEGAPKLSKKEARRQRAAQKKAEKAAREAQLKPAKRWLGLRAGRHGGKARWKLNVWALIPAIVGVAGITALLYPTAASWVSQYNQSQTVFTYVRQLDAVNPTAQEQIELAHKYNESLENGAELFANANVPAGTGEQTDNQLSYNAMLNAGTGSPMARLRIPAIDVDLPIYHGTSDETLLKGLGHLQGTSLPVGGLNQRSVITGHRGLAGSTLFTNLNKITEGDTFTIEVFGEILTYRVFDTRVISPDDTETLRVEVGRDLVTLVTCTPLGVNTHRILVTGERVTPTPLKDVEESGKASTLPHFPWWFFLYIFFLVMIAVYVWWEGTPAARARRPRWLTPRHSRKHRPRSQHKNFARK